MITLLRSFDLVEAPNFSVEDVLRGTTALPEQRNAAGRVWVELDGRPESLCLYGAVVDSAAPPVIYLEGDCSSRINGFWSVFDGYKHQSPQSVQRWIEQIAVSIGRPFLSLARPGVYGSTGDHQQRRRPREVLTVDAALSAMKQAFGWDSMDLVGFSGGGHLVAALLARRADIGCAVIASGNVSVRQRNEEHGWDADITGYADFVDPIDLVGEVAKHPPSNIIVLTDPEDRTVSALCQTAYVYALRKSGVVVEQRFVPATDAKRHVLRDAALLTAAANPSQPMRAS